MPALTNLANQADATAFGYGTITGGYFARASARIRGYTRQTITAGTSTILARAPIVQLPERPVTSVTSVTDVSDANSTYLLSENEYTLRAGGVLEVPNYGGNLEIVYEHGFATLPDELLELVCQVASRMSATPDAVASGAVQETGGSESVSYGLAAFNATSDLTDGEKRVLDRIFPKLAGVVVLRAGRPGSVGPSMTRFTVE